MNNVEETADLGNKQRTRTYIVRVVYPGPVRRRSSLKLEREREGY